MGDKAVKIFLNAKGTLDDVSDELKAFLDYVAGKKPKDAYVERQEEAVTAAANVQRNVRCRQSWWNTRSMWIRENAFPVCTVSLPVRCRRGETIDGCSLWQEGE